MRTRLIYTWQVTGAPMILGLVLLCLLGGRAWGQHVEHEKLPSNTEGQSLALAPVEANDGPKLQVSGRLLSTTPKKPKDPKAPLPPKHFGIRLFMASPDKKLEQLKVVVQYYLQNPAGGDPVAEGTEEIAVDYIEKLTAVTTKGYDIAKDAKPADPKAKTPKVANATTFLGVIVTVKDKDAKVLYLGVSDSDLKKVALNK